MRSSCTWMASLLYGSSHVSFSGLISRSSCNSWSIWKVSLLCASRTLILKITCHTLCTWMASLMCVFIYVQVTWCWEALVYTTQHFMHLNGFSPLWLLSWIMMWKSSWDFNGFFLHGSSYGTFLYFDPEKLLPHFVQLNGFSPMWVMSCYFKWLAIKKLLSHFDHLKGFNPVY